MSPFLPLARTPYRGSDSKLPLLIVVRVHIILQQQALGWGGRRYPRLVTHIPLFFQDYLDYTVLLQSTQFLYYSKIPLTTLVTHIPIFFQDSLFRSGVDLTGCGCSYQLDQMEPQLVTRICRSHGPLESSSICSLLIYESLAFNEIHTKGAHSLPFPSLPIPSVVEWKEEERRGQQRSDERGDRKRERVLLLEEEPDTDTQSDGRGLEGRAQGQPD